MSDNLNLAGRQTPHVDGRRSAPGRLFGWILGLAGLALVLLGGDEARRVVLALSWPTVSGLVESARVSNDTVASSVGKYRNFPVVQQRFHLAYRYQVDGVDYIGRRVDLLPVGRRHASADLRRYPAGSTVVVHYDRTRPDQAVLEARPPVRAGGMVLVGLGFLVLRWRLRRPKGVPAAASA
jgi:hypothetical protein